MSAPTTFVRHGVKVDTLAEAWEFVMSVVDTIPVPNVEITAHWSELAQASFYDVGVSGHVAVGSTVIDEAQVREDERNRFADAAAAQFASSLDYDGAEVKRRILIDAHLLERDHPANPAECPVCQDDDKLDGAGE